jgi:hypothetical protein
MKTISRSLTVFLLGLLLAAAAAASPRLEIGPLTRRLELPGLRACYVARTLGSATVGLRFLTTGAVIFYMDPAGHLWPVMHRANLFGVVTDPELGALLCTSRGVFSTRDGRYLRRLSSQVFTQVVAAPVGGLFARPGEGLYGFDGQQFQLIRAIPWRTIDSLAIEPGGAIWFVGSYTRADGSAAPTRLYVSRLKDDQPVVEDPLGAEESASAVAEYFGGIVATIDGRLRGTLDSGTTWFTFDDFARGDLTLASVPLDDAEQWQALWIGVRDPDVGPAPLWFDDYTQIVAQPINAARVRQITADLSHAVLLFVADEALFEATYRVLEDAAAP